MFFGLGVGAGGTTAPVDVAAGVVGAAAFLAEAVVVAAGVGFFSDISLCTCALDALEHVKKAISFAAKPGFFPPCLLTRALLLAVVAVGLGVAVLIGVVLAVADAVVLACFAATMPRVARAAP